MLRARTALHPLPPTSRDHQKVLKKSRVLRCFLLVVRTWGVFSFFSCKCASCHKGVQFFISHLASWLRTRRFSEPTFRPSGATNHWKNTLFPDFPTFSRTWIFFLRRLSLFDLLSSSLLFSDSSHLCFSSVHIVGSLAFKLPSMNRFIINIMPIRSQVPMVMNQLQRKSWR